MLLSGLSADVNPIAQIATIARLWSINDQYVDIVRKADSLVRSHISVRPNPSQMGSDFIYFSL